MSVRYIETFHELRQRARGGESFSCRIVANDMVDVATQWPLDNPLLFGVGRTYTVNLNVPNFPDLGRNARAALRVRIIRRRTRLFVSTELDWTTSGGHRHTAVACYQLSKAEFESLIDWNSRYGVTDGQLDTRTAGRLRIAEARLHMDTFEVMWAESIPGTTREEIDAQTTYHREVIDYVQRYGPPHATMIRAGIINFAHQDEFVVLAESLRDLQPDATN